MESVWNQTKRDASTVINPVKSPNDARAYRVITLPNKLSVILVSDSNTTTASAAMDVNVGHFSDPEDTPGLAHLLEHMLFLGTSQFPIADELCLPLRNKVYRDQLSSFFQVLCFFSFAWR
jgi:secreted Zn-dependent insulinase-like peptidase